MTKSQSILHYLDQQKRPCKTKEIMAALGYNRNTTWCSLRNLHEGGLVKKAVGKREPGDRGHLPALWSTV